MMFAGILLLVTGLLLYAGTLSYGFIELDDPLLITENPAAQALTLNNIKTVFTTYDPELYIPLTFVSYQFDAAIGGLNPFFFHLHNLLQHILNAWLVVMLAWMLTRKKPLSVVAGLLFLVHPLQVETVLWASARKDLLSTTFFLISLILSVRFIRTRDWKMYGGSIATFLLGLLSKVTVISLAPVLFLADWIDGKKITRQSLLEKIPYLILAVIFGIVALFGKFDAAPVSPLKRILASCTSLVFSMLKVIAPVHLSPIYADGGEITLTSPMFFLPLLIVIGVLSGAFLLRKRWKVFSCGVAFIVLTYAPSFANIMKGGEYYLTTDRYAYIPLIGIAILAALAWDAVRMRLEKKLPADHARGVTYGAAGALLVILGFLSLQQANLWRDPLTLSQHVVAVAPNARIGHLWRGNVLRDAGQYDEALEQYRIALSIIDDAQVHYNRGLTYQLQDKLDDAITDYRKALELQPVYPLAHINLGQLDYFRGRTEDARKQFEAAAKEAPQLAMPFYNLGVLEGERKNFEAAAGFYRQALERDPALSDARANLVIALLALGKTAEAVDQLKTTLTMDPENPTARATLDELIKAGVVKNGL